MNLLASLKKQLKQQCVRVNSKGQTLFPKNIPKERTGRAYYFMTVCSMALLIGSFFVVTGNIVEKFLFQVGTFTIFTLILAVIELIRRICFLVEERSYLYGRYEGNYRNLLDAIWPETKSNYVIIFCIFSLTLFIITNTLPFSLNTLNDIFAFFLTTSAVLLMQHTFKFNECGLYNSMKLMEMKGADYGSGMAHSFFHGYLKIVLPADGYTNLNIKDLMEQYANTHGIVFQMQKLYILVPLSLYCPNEITGSNLTPAKTLDSIKKNVAGVINRSYKNSVYKIRVEDTRDPVYICAEYATPLRTLHEVIIANNDAARFYQKHLKDIIWNFYTTTTKLINDDPKTKGLCELIYFDDKIDGELINVGHVLATKVLKDRKREYLLEQRKTM